MKITWIGHSALKLEGSKTVYIDPFITGNPVSKINLNSITKADVVVVTHDHEIIWGIVTRCVKRPAHPLSRFLKSRKPEPNMVSKQKE